MIEFVSPFFHFSSLFSPAIEVTPFSCVKVKGLFVVFSLMHHFSPLTYMSYVKEMVEAQASFLPFLGVPSFSS